MTWTSVIRIRRTMVVMVLLVLLVAVVTNGFVFVPHHHHRLPLAPLQHQQQHQQRVTVPVFQSSQRESCGDGWNRRWQLCATRSNSNNNINSNSNSNKRRPRSVLDRTPEEARALMQDILQTVVTAGPRTGPIRTIQALDAIRTTSQEFVVQALQQQQQQSTTTSTKSSSSSQQQQQQRQSITDQIPKYLRLFFERMGSTYIKLGQFIASSPSLFPAAYVTEFQSCLDATTPLPYSTIHTVLQQELPNYSQIFAYIDETPLASASIAQVHAARLVTGENVVIKVQKPNIDTVLQADLGFLFLASRILEYLQPDWERTSLSAVTSDIRNSMLQELDFELEARNTIEFRRFLQENGLLNVATAPLVYLQHSTKKILVLERLNGVSMLDDRMLSLTKDPTVGTEAILTALNIWTLSIRTMPWFHADVHAGNLLLLNDGRVGFIDFGIVGRISPQILTAVTELSTALVNQDSLGMARALCQMGATDANVNLEQFAQDIDTVLNRLYNNVVPSIMEDITITTDGRQITGATAQLNVNDEDITNLLLEVVQMTEQNGLKLPREFGLLVKQSLYFDRYLKILAPGVNIMEDERVVGTISGSRPTTSTKTVIDV